MSKLFSAFKKSKVHNTNDTAAMEKQQASSRDTGISLDLANTSRDMFLETNNLYDASKKVYETSDMVMKLVEKDNHSIAIVNKSISSISNNIDSINSESVKTEELSQANISSVDIGKQKISDVVSNMDSLAGTNKSFSEVVEKLQKSSQSIYKVIEYIDDVAKKTNMLSLNASIEAARAGEAGKGFMVITSEISKLAAQSGDFSSNIKKFLTEIEQYVESIRDMVSINNEKINSTHSAINEVKDTLDTIVDKSANLHSNIGKIMESSEHIKKSASDASERSLELMTTHENTLELMREDISEINRQWSIVEHFKVITERLTKLSDTFLSKSLDEKVEKRLMEIGMEIMNYKGDKSTEALQELSKKLGVQNIFYADKNGVFEHCSEMAAAKLNIFQLDKRFVEFTKSGEAVRPYPLSRRFDTGEVCKFMAVKRLDAAGVISVGLSIEDLIRL